MVLSFLYSLCVLNLITPSYYVFLLLFKIKVVKAKTISNHLDIDFASIDTE